jgi:hypothetical protein
MHNVDASLIRHTVAAQSKPSNVIPRCLWSPLKTEDMNDGNATVRPRIACLTRVVCIVARASETSTTFDFRVADVEGTHLAASYDDIQPNTTLWLPPPLFLAPRPHVTLAYCSHHHPTRAQGPRIVNAALVVPGDGARRYLTGRAKQGSAHAPSGVCQGLANHRLSGRCRIAKAQKVCPQRPRTDLQRSGRRITIRPSRQTATTTDPTDKPSRQLLRGHPGPLFLTFFEVAICHLKFQPRSPPAHQDGRR